MAQLKRSITFAFRSHSTQCGSDLFGDLMTATALVLMLYLGIAGICAR